MEQAIGFSVQFNLIFFDCSMWFSLLVFQNLASFDMVYVISSVTTTNQAIMALKMLRENKNKYDLVISDVRMPDMDGFKLLELVGLEMDLPVISKH